MRPAALLLARPRPLLVLFVALALSLIVTWLHLRTGLAYEFHLFFGLPVLLVAWYSSMRAGIAMAIAVTGLWFAADLRLGGTQADPLPLFFNSAIRLLLFIVSAGLIASLRRLLERESRLAREDALTGLCNRREFLEQGEYSLALAARQEIPVTTVFLDLDYFKELNDSLGHKAGDAALVAVAGVLRGHLRASDIGGRLGGDEFALLLPGMSAAGARAYVERLRRDLLDAMAARDWPVRFSIGVATHALAPADIATLIAAADALMYEVKRGGRDGTLLREYVGLCANACEDSCAGS